MHDEIIKAKADPKDDYKISRCLPCCPLRKKKPLSSEEFEMEEKYATDFENNIYKFSLFVFMMTLFQFLGKLMRMTKLRKGKAPRITLSSL